MEATTVIVNAFYRATGGRLVIAEKPFGTEAPADMSVRIEVEGDVLRWTGPDGSTVRKERLGRAEAGKPGIVGAWKYRHDTGTTAFERYTDDGRMFFRLPMKSWVGRYVLKGSQLVLTRPNQADVVMQVVLQSDDLSLSTGGRTTTYRRDHAGPWYRPREHHQVAIRRAGGRVASDRQDPRTDNMRIPAVALMRQARS